MNFVPSVFIGSSPFSFSEALKDIAAHYPSIPCLPQSANMIEGLAKLFPGYENGKVIEDEKFAIEVEALLSGQSVNAQEREIDEFLSFFGKSDSFYLKTQIVGPLSFGLSIANSRGEILYYNFKEIVDFFIADQAGKQAQQLASSGKKTIVFVDEPSFSNFGSSSLIAISKEEVLSSWKTVVDAIKNEGAIPGIHVCGNCDWGMVLSAGFQIISFDVKHFKKLFAYRHQLDYFLRTGGWLCWGLIPTNEHELKKVTAKQLFNRWFFMAVKFGELGFSFGGIVKKTLVSPACGLGTLSPEMAQLAMKLTHDVAINLTTAIK